MCEAPCSVLRTRKEKRKKRKVKKATEIPGARILIFTNKEKQQEWAGPMSFVNMVMVCLGTK